MAVLKYLNYARVYEYVDGNVPHEEMEVTEKLEEYFHPRLDSFHCSVAWHGYHVNISHLIRVINPDPVRNLGEQWIPRGRGEGAYLALRRLFCVTWGIVIYLNDDLLEQKKKNTMNSFFFGRFCSRLFRQYLMSFISMLANRLRTKRDRRIKRGVV